jgi:hypothetical protein
VPREKTPAAHGALDSRRSSVDMANQGALSGAGESLPEDFPEDFSWGSRVKSVRGTLTERWWMFSRI